MEHFGHAVTHCVTSADLNVLINREHPAAARVEICDLVPFDLDARPL